MEELKEQTYCNRRGQCTIDREGKIQGHRYRQKDREIQREILRYS